MQVLLLPLFFVIVWIIIDRHERKLNRGVKPKKQKDYPVIYHKKDKKTH